MPANELVPGDELRLVDGASAWVTAVECEAAAAGERFTTYNFEVAGCHTYQVGRAGVWVHNAGQTTCGEVVEDLFSRADDLAEMLRDNKKLQAAIAERLKHKRAALEATSPDVSSEFLDAEFRQHAQDIEKMFLRRAAQPNTKEYIRLLEKRLNGTLSDADKSELAAIIWKHRKFDFNEYLTKLFGPMPTSAEMYRAHAHHILFKLGLKDGQAKLVLEGLELLDEVGIDGVFSLANLVWAPSGKGQHATSSLKSVLEALRPHKGDRGGILQTLNELGERAAERGR